MKAFKKWLNGFNTAAMSRTEIMLQERAWKASLEWVLAIDFSHAMDKKFLLKKIEQELKDESV